MPKDKTPPPAKKGGESSAKKMEGAASWIFGRVTKGAIGDKNAEAPKSSRRERARKDGSHRVGKHRKKKEG